MRVSLLSALAALVVSVQGQMLLPTLDESCCFRLSATLGNDVHVAVQSASGIVALHRTVDAPASPTSFCLDQASGSLWSQGGDRCLMRGPQQQLTCLTEPVKHPHTSFGLSSPSADGVVYLTHSAGIGRFYADPLGASANHTYDIHPISHSDDAHAFPVQMTLIDSTKLCPSPYHAPASGRSPWLPRRRRTAQSAAASTAIAVGEAPRACSVSPSSPSIAPVEVGLLDQGALDGMWDSSGHVTIARNMTTALLYNVPKSFGSGPFSNGTSRLCALQFRMPVCSELPAGYPCYNFSGLEQEVVSNSGMYFELLFGGDDTGARWNDTALHQVWPGKDSIIGTFGCSGPVGSYGARQMLWRMSSVRGFVLHFLQAGVGSGAQFRDGVGAWIVQCG